MKRRDVLRLSAALPLALATRSVRGQAKTITRAAVVIGIDQPVKLPPLNAAVSGATNVGDWLKSEGFEVKLLTDETKPVKAADVFDAVDGLVSLDTLKQLVIYFAGHGCFVKDSDYWLLSQALNDSSQAIRVGSASFLRSRLCGIQNVVLISDACRSTSADLGIQELEGIIPFPPKNNTKVFTYLDWFFGARIGLPTYEVKNDAWGSTVPIFYLVRL
jgi:hypothetical protein